MPATRKPNPIDTYRTHLQQLSDWDDYLRQESRLPGPRANLELLEAVIQAGDGCRFAHLLALDNAFLGGAPPNTPDEFLTVCAVAGLGKLVAEGDIAWLSVLRRRAADGRWRVREAVAIGLQHWGDHNMLALVDEMRSWSSGGWLEQRAAVAALAEPRLLRTAACGIEPTGDVIPIFDTITECIVAAAPAARRDPDYQILRQALGYAWSVLVAANPAICRPPFERWLLQAESTHDKDLLWITRQNLKKNRLQVLDAIWADSWATRLAPDAPPTSPVVPAVSMAVLGT
ncbi:MAG: hypothetical protein U0X20_11040 [Caldilineaceae bacterium]